MQIMRDLFLCRVERLLNLRDHEPPTEESNNRTKLACAAMLAAAVVIASQTIADALKR